jgi:hypothetical protein
MNIHEKFAHLRAAYLMTMLASREEARVAKVLKQQRYFSLEGTQEF